ncbi:hypothetical protein ACO2Q0_14520 [Phenylobacterium sp. VNQ135]|uniref:hypothetical protein n=1 Tax=Phenylobacterium sp. VNQ135 TaxID=3400922 RepID=UPI003C02635F
MRLGGEIWAYVVPLAFIGIAVLRNARGRRLRVERMWIAPALILFATVMTFAYQPAPGPWSILAYAAALGLGVALGWWRGRLTHIAVDPETHVLTGKASPLGMLLILGIFAARLALRGVASANASALHVTTTQITDALLLLAVGLVCTNRLEMALRATRLLREARAR